jgi:16S rRNA (adenine1518-N6/adenine1519-N6)-dimethyltransferase
MSGYVKPLKQYGQNFLNSEAIAREIVKALDLNSGDTVIEIGAGKGVLTNILAESRPRKLMAVEYDKRLSTYLEHHIKPDSDFEVLNTDFMKFDINKSICGERIKVIGNIPYHLTSAILYKLIDNYKCIAKAVLMVQKEVADRVTAKPGLKIYGSLSVVMSLHGNIKKIIDVPRSNFFPVPKVDSAVIVIDFYQDIEGVHDYNLLRELIDKVFETRRKMIHNGLRRSYGAHIIDEINSTDLRKRPEQLSVFEFKQLANEIHQLKKVDTYNEISTRH